jgi:ketosteroid isomerase-like protein
MFPERLIGCSNRRSLSPRLAGSNEGSDMERSADLEAWLKDGYASMERGDVDALDGVVSRAEGTVMIGTDPNEWWHGHDAIRKAFEEQVEAFGGGFPLTAGDPRAYVEGDVGWISDRPSFRLPDDVTVTTRLTGVVHRENDGWCWVQAHFSIGVPNEDAFAQVPLA